MAIPENQSSQLFTELPEGGVSIPWEDAEWAIRRAAAFERRLDVGPSPLVPALVALVGFAVACLSGAIGGFLGVWPWVIWGGGMAVLWAGEAIAVFRHDRWEHAGEGWAWLFVLCWGPKWVLYLIGLGLLVGLAGLTGLLVWLVA